MKIEMVLVTSADPDQMAWMCWLIGIYTGYIWKLEEIYNKN
jgi:hypothetical protein